MAESYVDHFLVLGEILKKSNRLIHESSPYLLQHAQNPVHWYPWCEDTINTAQKENLPIFLSIGYSACHWCHVMEAESFEYEKIAEFLNTEWSTDIPLIACFTIVPGNKIKLLPPPQSNVIFAGILTDSDDYSQYLGFIAHEFAHRTFTEQTLESHQQIDAWLTNSNSHAFLFI